MFRSYIWGILQPYIETNYCTVCIVLCVHTMNLMITLNYYLSLYYSYNRYYIYKYVLALRRPNK